jgi:hypothetical protein
MNRDEIYLYLLAAQTEFEQLCRSIVHDGRDPYIVAGAMTEKLGTTVRRYQALWDAAA